MAKLQPRPTGIYGPAPLRRRDRPLGTLPAALRLGLVLGLAIGSGAASAPPAWAAGKPDAALRQRAREMSDDAARMFKSGKFAEAAERIEQAYALDPSVPVRLYNAGRAWEEAGRVDRALHCFERYLQVVEDAKERAEVAERIRRLKAAPTPVGAAASGAGPASPGGGASADPARPSAGSGAHPVTTVAADPARGSRWLAWTTSAGAVALLGTGIGWHLATNAAAERIDQKSGQYDYPGGAAKRDDDHAVIARNRAVAWGATALGAAAGGVAAWLWLRSSPAQAALLPAANGRGAAILVHF